MNSESSGTKAAISLPKGGGAIKGIGETFQPNLFTGTGNFAVPIATSPGRNGFGPQLTLQYSPGNGNGPFGLGWQLSIPRITRKTEKGLPTYTEQDVFVLSGAENLVPVSDAQGHPSSTVEQAGYDITLYRPRTEGAFVRIERWQSHDNPNEVHWRATTKENVTSLYGKSASARLVDPDHPTHIFEWLLEETFDAKGNHRLYEYVQEDPNLTLPGLHERHRRYTQAYLRRILYGNTPDNLEASRKAGPERMASHPLDPSREQRRHYLFEVLFDYSDPPDPLPVYDTSPPDSPWWDRRHDDPSAMALRPDPFSTFRAGFEIRTLRLCHRVLMLHHFTEGELLGAPLVKSTHFTYTQDPHAGFSVLKQVTVWGHRKDPHDAASYLSRDLPPVTFGYSKFKPQQQRYQSVTAEAGDGPPLSLTDPSTTLMDIFGDGMPDVVQSTPNGFYYWENRGDARLARRRPLAHDMPAGITLGQPHVAVGDLGGDGLADLVVEAPPLSGFFEATPAGGWQPFKPLASMPSINFSDPDVRLVDLTGDGLSDVLITRDTHLLWFRSKGEAGYEAPQRLPRLYDLDVFPDVFFSDPAGRVRLADMTGDGLNDIVMVHDGYIDYWPNLGYGHWGKRLSMSNTPRIGRDFDPRRVFLADLDGTGCADLVDVDFNQVHFWFNQSGNSWSEQHTIHGTPSTVDTTGLQFTDFYGTGTACLVWSYDYGSIPGSNYKVLDFCGAKKPHLLVEMSNNMGATTWAQYASSTKFALADKQAGHPWVTNLPFPVQVLEKSEVIDHISQTKLVTTYTYHHGYYDGREREFRGFGRVDQCDTEFFDQFTGAGIHGEEAVFTNTHAGFHVPPIETRTWFHTGIYFDPERFVDHRELTHQYHREYYQDDPDAFTLDDHVFFQANDAAGPGATPHEAYRALHGATLRTEVYGRDNTAKATHPYVVTEHRYRVQALQPKNGNNHAVYLTLPKETLSYHYERKPADPHERKPADPRIAHTLTLGMPDDYGNITDSVTIGYPRRVVPDELPEQGDTTIVYTRTDFINTYHAPTETTPAYYYTGLPCQSRTYEITGMHWKFGQRHFEAQDFANLLDTSIAVDTQSFMPYEWQRDETDTEVHRRLIEWTRTYYRADADPEHLDPIGTLAHRLPLGEVESLALPYEAYKVAFTNAMLQYVYQGRTAGTHLAEEGGYHPHPQQPTAEGSGDIAAYWWIPAGRASFDAQKFFQATRAQDPFGNVTSSESDVYALLVETVRDALPAPQTNVISAINDYRVLQPSVVTDPNGNRSQVAFDALGLVVGTAVMGKDAAGSLVGDSLDPFEADLTEAVRLDHLANPLTDPQAILRRTTTRLVYDLFAYYRTKDQPDPQPAVVYTLARETHDSDPVPAGGLKIQHSFSYSDGFGREIQKKIQAEAGPVPRRDANGKIIVRPDGQPEMTPNEASPRWVGSGWTVFNNKGKPVRQYEPFFTDTHRFEFDVRIGVSPILFYDPVERVVAALHPNHTWEKVVFDPCQQTTYDVNDTVLNADGSTDPKLDQDVKGFFSQLPDADYVPTWYEQSRALTAHDPERMAAENAAVHRQTPTVAHFDTLGRPFLTIAHNRFERNNAIVEEKYRTSLELDIEGNQRVVIDAKDRVVMRYDYDMLGNRLHQASMEAGERWMLNDVTGKPIRAWASRGHMFRTEYDALRRATRSFVTGADPQDATREMCVQVHIYGEEAVHAPPALNLHGKLFMLCDGAGVVVHADQNPHTRHEEAYDFKGNPLRTTRYLAQAYKKTVDWNAVNWKAVKAALAAHPLQLPDVLVPLAALLETAPFPSSITYDALNRPVSVTTPDHSVYRPSFNEANLLDRVDVNLRGATANGQPVWTPFVTNLNYNAKGQRELIAYANGATTTYSYDPATFRLTNLKTTRPPNLNGLATQLFQHPGTVQNLRYTYDPAGNITRMADEALLGIVNNNQPVDPACSYTYDAIYRLIEATGREHIGQTAHDFNPQNRRDYDFVGLADFLVHPNDLQALRNYTERYEYDAVGNFDVVRHSANGGSWTRHYDYAEDSLIEPGKPSNRLTRTTVGNGGNHIEIYTYTDAQGNDVHGCMTSINSMEMIWNFADQLHQVELGGGGTAYYVYDAGGQRVRKVWEKAANLVEERLYLGGFEVYRKYNGNGQTITLERDTLHVMDDQQRIALVETKTIDNGVQINAPTPTPRFQFGNHLGSASLELDEHAQIISYEEYYPYGSTSYQAGRSAAEVSLKRHRYTGKERDEESGLNYHGARYYAPWLGRWMSCDPAGLIDGTNLYRYARNNPVGLTDPTGTDSERLKNYPLRVISIDDLPSKDQPNFKPPTSDRENRDLVTVNNLDENRTELKPMNEVRSSNEYVDTGIRSVGAEFDNLMYLNIKALRYTYKNKPDALIPISAIDFESGETASQFFKLNGVIYPVSANGDVALNRVNTPNIVAGAWAKLGDRANVLTEREQIAWTVYSFAQTIQASAGTAYAVPHGSFRSASLAQSPINAMQPSKGAGPAPGTFGVAPGTKSVKGLQNYSPKQGAIEFVFDPEKSIFVVGKPKGPAPAFFMSPHERLAATINANPTKVVGGLFSNRGGMIMTNEFSGHFWQNWNPAVRQQFVDFMRSKGLNVNHHEGM